eukprot:CAMPEP_0201928520 /NCGR_PEP_ID=MMETSP0903-20130614/21083_1 /ASSEMBLY_ACC=CAM_ASM_000552 /TAXON_ID=420261 /ORGANISM="Thalassiosira antarctica, Strain CCMP982" /LENGTH=129 /DNA_ID=CAMNT_0048467001 /DNA_START=184 /DNA_END=574 /DNA_ORIENTATION=+
MTGIIEEEDEHRVLEETAECAAMEMYVRLMECIILTNEDVSRRIHNFFTWLMQQPHDNTAIVTHGVWMECALLDYFPEVLEFGKKRVYNCEVYSGKLSLVVGSLVVDGNNGDGNSVVLKDVEQMSFYHV